MLTGLPNCTFGDLFNRMFTKWGQPTPHDITANEEQMKAPWDPQERDIGNVIKQINDGNLFGYFVGHKKNNNNLVTIGKKSFLIQDYLQPNTANGTNYHPMNACGLSSMSFGPVRLICGMRPQGRRCNMAMG